MTKQLFVFHKPKWLLKLLMAWKDYFLRHRLI